MVTLFLIGGFLALLHFVYQGIFLPSYRCFMRLRLFKLRDQLRMLHIQSQIDDEVFEHAQSSINIAINMLPTVDLYVLRNVSNEMRQDSKLARKLAKRQEEMSSKASEEVKEILKSCYRIGAVTACLNNGGWSFYIIPILGVFGIAEAGRSVCKLVSIPEHDAQKFVPQCEMA